MRLLFYAPLKPPDHAVPSGDRRVARLLIDAFSGAGHRVEIAARLRSLDLHGDTERQMRIAALGRRLAARLAERILRRPAAERPRAFVTYHLYYKAPDWIGPSVAARLGLPYVAIEASVAMKRAGGPWSLGHEAVLAALRRAAAVVSLNPADEAGVLPFLAAPDRVHRLKPFLDSAPYARAAGRREEARAALARRFGLDTAKAWLLAVAMMRPGDKLASYRVLAEALAKLRVQDWQLLLVGDGSARADVQAAMAPLGPRAVCAGALAEGELPGTYAACDLYVWPAVNEAFGMAILEAQASGVPVVAGRSGGVGELVADGLTGVLTPVRDADGFAAAVDALLGNPERRAALGAAALAKVAAVHDLAAAGRALDASLARAVAGAKS